MKIATLTAATLIMASTAVSAMDFTIAGQTLSAGGKADVNYDTGTELWAMEFVPSVGLNAWGTDFKKVNNEWSTENAKNYRPKGQTKPVDAFQLRVNSYRVLLTRGRDGVIVYISAELDEMQETYDYLVDCGFDELKN